jgi:hypothetical protein
MNYIFPRVNDVDGILIVSLSSRSPAAVDVSGAGSAHDR